MATTICNTAKNNYIAAKITMTNATDAYQPCSTSNPSEYPAPDQILQPIPDPVAQRKTIANALQTKFNDQVALYTSLLSSTNALIAATQPLKDYKSILTSQLNANNKQNQILQEQVTTGSNTINQVNSEVPELASNGPFGSINLQNGVTYTFLTLYSLFFMSLSAVLYLQFKNTVSFSVLIPGIGIMLGGATIGGYYSVMSTGYGLGVQPIFL